MVAPRPAIIGTGRRDLPDAHDIFLDRQCDSARSLSARYQHELAILAFDPAAGRAIYVAGAEGDQAAAIISGRAGNAQPVAPFAGKCTGRQRRFGGRARASGKQEYQTQYRSHPRHYVSALRQVEGDKCTAISYIAPNTGDSGKKC